MAFVCVLTGIDSLAGLFAPKKPSGERFRLFVLKYFPDDHKEYSQQFWDFRNAMIHSFNSGPFALTCQTSRNHLKTISTASGDMPILNIEDFFSALLVAYRNYFDSLFLENDLQSNFQKRISQDDGGAPQTWSMTEHRH